LEEAREKTSTIFPFFIHFLFSISLCPLQIFPMMKNCAILLALCALHIVFAANDELTLEIESDELMKTGDLEQAETKDASATEIIKQIRKLNPDGTFTIGFEAVSATFSH
jgi:hypothetical protein